MEVENIKKQYDINVAKLTKEKEEAEAKYKKL